MSWKKGVKKLKGPELWSESRILKFKIAEAGQLCRGWDHEKGQDMIKCP